MTALFYAIKDFERINAVELLLQNGVDPDVKDKVRVYWLTAPLAVLT